MNGPFNNAGLFLVQTLFGLYILAIMLRFLLQWVRADFYNPLVQALVKITRHFLQVFQRHQGHADIVIDELFATWAIG